MSTAHRIDRVVEALGERKLDSLLVTDLTNVRYLTGFTGSNGACLIGPDQRMFMTDFRYVEQAQSQVDGFDQSTASRELALELAPRCSGRAGFDDAKMSVRTHGKVAEKLAAGVELVAAGGLVERVREVKDASELKRIAAATDLATAALERVLEDGLVGRTEREVAQALEAEMRAGGASGPSFDSIVAAGAHGASPHAEPREVEIPRDTLLVVDWGAVLDGYCSDCTRTFATGPLDGAAAAIYELVLDAQLQALDAVRAGADCVAVDKVARDVIAAAGHAEHFGHGLGHGVGLEIHEGPRLSKTGEGELAVGTVVSVEPGVYLPGEVGVRIEDLVAVTADGADVFTSMPKTLTTVS